ncbi:hypothetical protein G3N96_33415 [Burkholderia sp. Se-20373]|uniref:hypothetical protein n=1 Tax=Burkholderia sp. Se-20373 TaxID=2703898 RepID=UPI0019804F83|nr:hypothetical protein [Burkholderia sp. Se-20373]MBN3750284.1 hypothetical protein [Burkholderia sp. Se-20373]
MTRRNSADSCAFGTKSPHPAHGPHPLERMSSSTDYFSAAVRIDAKTSDDSMRPATWRPAIRPHRAAPFYQGIPGIFSHFLRNIG